MVAVRLKTSHRKQAAHPDVLLRNPIEYLKSWKLKYSRGQAWVHKSCLYSAKR